MKPVEFVLWLNGAAELVGDQPPTPEQWATMREKLGEAVGGLVAARLLERAEETLRADERRKKEEAEKAKVMEQMTKVRSNHGPQKMLSLANALPAGTIIEVPEMPKPRNPGLLNRILGKATT